MSNEMSGPEVPEEPTASDDLKTSKAKFWKSSAKLVGALTLGLVPASVGWIDSKTEAQTALTAAATEKATSAEAYGALVERIEAQESISAKVGEVVEEYGEELGECHDMLIRLDERVAVLQRRLGLRDVEPVAARVEEPPPPPPEPSAPKPKDKLAELLKAAAKKKPLAKERPRPKAEEIMQIQQQYQEGAF